MSGNNSLFGMLLITALAFVLYRYSRHKAGKTRAHNAATYLSITRKQLYRIALGPYIRKLVFMLLPFAIVLTAACIGRRIAPLTTLISFALMAAFIILLCLPHLRSQSVPLTHLRKFTDFDELFSGKHLYWQNDAWGYADKEWFIRLGEGYSVALRASDIDFSKPARKVFFRCYIPAGFKNSSGKEKYICHMRFTGHDGKTITACTQADANILQWIHNHGGTLAG